MLARSTKDYLRGIKGAGKSQNQMYLIYTVFPGITNEMQLLVLREINCVQKLVRITSYFRSFQFKYIIYRIAFSKAGNLILSYHDHHRSLATITIPLTKGKKLFC